MSTAVPPSRGVPLCLCVRAGSRRAGFRASNVWCGVRSTARLRACASPSTITGLDVIPWVVLPWWLRGDGCGTGHTYTSRCGVLVVRWLAEAVVGLTGASVRL